MNECVIPCMHLMVRDSVSQEDLDVIELIRNCWCSYLGQDMDGGLFPPDFVYRPFQLHSQLIVHICLLFRFSSGKAQRIPAQSPGLFCRNGGAKGAPESKELPPRSVQPLDCRHGVHSQHLSRHREVKLDMTLCEARLKKNTVQSQGDLTSALG